MNLELNELREWFSGHFWLSVLFRRSTVEIRGSKREGVHWSGKLEWLATYGPSLGCLKPRGGEGAGKSDPLQSCCQSTRESWTGGHRPSVWKVHWTFCGQKCLLPISQSLVLPGIIVARGLNIIVHIAECDMRVNSFPAKVRLPWWRLYPMWQPSSEFWTSLLGMFLCSCFSLCTALGCEKQLRKGDLSPSYTVV